MFIADEVQSGMGRAGRWFAIEDEGVVPDLITSAKSLGGGLPISAVTGRADVMDSVHVGGLGGTYGREPRRGGRRARGPRPDREGGSARTLAHARRRRSSGVCARCRTGTR